MRKINLNRKILYFSIKQKLLREYIYIVYEFETIERIIKKKCSICRYGDCEFKLAVGDGQKGYQMKDKLLQKRLCQILKSNHKKILIGIPNIFYKEWPKQISEKTKNFWKKYNSLNILRLYLNKKIYYSSFITRGDNAPKIMCYEYWDRIKDIWRNRKIIFVEGGKKLSSCSLFKDCNITITKIILAPRRDAFSKYNDILKECLEYDKDNLFIIALGPTATVLAYDLGIKGYQALDLGHIGMFYNIFFKK